jgi:hypothetical protein
MSIITKPFAIIITYNKTNPSLVWLLRNTKEKGKRKRKNPFTLHFKLLFSTLKNLNNKKERNLFFSATT